MDIHDKIREYIDSLPEGKQSDMQILHRHILEIIPGCKLWFDNGLNAQNKVVTNPTIGYGHQVLKYVNGNTKDFFQIGVSGNATGISVYIMGLPDKTYLPSNFGTTLGKASVTGYCIKFKKLKDIDLNTLDEAIRYGVSVTGA